MPGLWHFSQPAIRTAAIPVLVVQAANARTACSWFPAYGVPASSQGLGIARRQGPGSPTGLNGQEPDEQRIQYCAQYYQ